MFEIKKTSREIIIGVFITLLSAAIIGHCSGIFGGSNSPDRETIKAETLKILRAYCNELNSPDHNQFDAYRYFAPHVDRYIKMKNTTPAEINKYIKGLFRKQYQYFSTDPDVSTFVITAVADEYYEVTLITYDTYLNLIDNNTCDSCRTRTEIRMDKNFRIKYFRLLND